MGARLLPPPRRGPRLDSLHDRMMMQACDVIRHNWTDVAIHDRRKLRLVPENHVCIWGVSSVSSFLCPLYSGISLKKQQLEPGKNYKSIAHLHFARLFATSQLLRGRVDVTSDWRYWFIIKKSAGNGEIIESSFAEAVNLICYGEWQWVKNVGFVEKK